MPRTIEGIVASHRHAAALRQAGRPIWTRQVRIRDLLVPTGDRSIERVSGVAIEIAARLRRALPPSFFDITDDEYERDLDEAVEDLESYTVDALTRLEKEEGLAATDMLDARLDELYDWADRSRTWLG